jgi:hypothetical protein
MINQVTGRRRWQRGDYRGSGRAAGDGAGEEERVETLIRLSGLKHGTSVRRLTPRSLIAAIFNFQSHLSNPKRVHSTLTSYLPRTWILQTHSQLQSYYYYHSPVHGATQEKQLLCPRDPSIIPCRHRCRKRYYIELDSGASSADKVQSRLGVRSSRSLPQASLASMGAVPPLLC